MKDKNPNQGKIRRRVVLIITVSFLLCFAESLGWASHSKDIHSLTVEEHPENTHEQEYHKNSFHNAEQHKNVYNTGHVENEQKKMHDQGNRKTEHSESNTSHLEKHGHSVSIPLIYKLYWIGLIFLIVLILIYFLIIYKREKVRPLKPLAIFLLLLALFLYLLEQAPIFTGYYHPVKGFISGYHEPNTIGFLRFLYKLFAGIALCVYGFTTFFAHQKRNYRESSE